MEIKPDSFGAAVRQYRQEKQRTLRRMARELNISPAALSAIEVTNKKVSPDLDERIINYLDLTGDKKRELEKLAADRGREIRIPLANASSSTKELAVMFARKFNDLGDEEVDKIHQILHSINHQRKKA